MNNILLATEEDRQQILDLYEEQKGREFCPWDDLYHKPDFLFVKSVK